MIAQEVYALPRELQTGQPKKHHRSPLQARGLDPRVPRCLSAALTGQDLRLRKETAQWIWDRVVPDLNGKKSDDGHDTFQLVINQPHVQTRIGETMANVAQMLGGLRDAISRQDPNQHVLIGTDALPTPPGQLEVSGGPAPIETDRKAKSDFLTEVIEKREK